EGLVDLGLRLGGRVRRLDRLLAGAEGVDLCLQLLRGAGQLLLLALELRVLLLEVGQLAVEPGLARERLAGEVLSADLDRLLGLPGQLARLALQLGDLHLHPLAAGGHVGDPASYLREHLQLPLVAVVEGLARVLRAVERLAGLRLEDHRESLPQAHRMVPLIQVRVRAAAGVPAALLPPTYEGNGWPGYIVPHRSAHVPPGSARVGWGSSRTTHPKAM